MEKRSDQLTCYSVCVDGTYYDIDPGTKEKLREGIVPSALKEKITRDQGSDACYDFCRQQRLIRQAREQIENGQLPAELSDLIESGEVPADILYKLTQHKLVGKAEKLYKAGLLTEKTLTTVRKKYLSKEILLQAVRQQCRLVVDMSRLLKYAQDLPDDSNSLHRFDVQLAKLDKEIAHNQEMKIHLVENLNSGLLSREEYQELSAMYDKRIKDTRQAKLNVEAERNGLKDLPLEGEWLKTFKKYQTFTELDRMMLAELIDFIEIHNDKQLTIHFKFADQIQCVQQYLDSLPALREKAGGKN